MEKQINYPIDTREYCEHHKDTPMFYRKDRKGKYCPKCMGYLTRGK